MALLWKCRKILFWKLGVSREFNMRKGWKQGDDAWNMNYENLKALSLFHKAQKMEWRFEKIWINANKTLILTNIPTRYSIFIQTITQACCQPSNRAALNVKWEFLSIFFFWSPLQFCLHPSLSHLTFTCLRVTWKSISIIFTTKSAEALSNFHHKFFPRDSSLFSFSLHYIYNILIDTKYFQIKSRWIYSMS